MKCHYNEKEIFYRRREKKNEYQKNRKKPITYID